MRLHHFLESLAAAEIDLLAPRGQSHNIGPERGTSKRDGIAHYTSPHGSHRFVFWREGQALAALQVMNHGNGLGVIANVITRPEARRQGLATQLITSARKVFREVRHNSDLSADGRAWASTVGGEISK